MYEGDTFFQWDRLNLDKNDVPVHFNGSFSLSGLIQNSSSFGICQLATAERPSKPLLTARHNKLIMPTVRLRKLNQSNQLKIIINDWFASKVTFRNNLSQFPFFTLNCFLNQIKIIKINFLILICRVHYKSN